MPAVDAPIVAVTVFSDRARVTRRGKITLERGEHILMIPNLPTTLEQDSVRASGHGAGVKITGLEVKTEFIAEAPEAVVAALQKQLDDLYDQDRLLLTDDNIYKDKLEFLDRIRIHASENFGKAVPYAETKLDNITAFSNYLQTQLSEAHSQRRDIERKREKLAKEIEAVQKRMAQVAPEKDERREIQVGVEVAGSIEFELEVVYSVRNAGWTPFYDVRLLEDEVSLTYMATVTHKSGEDWHEVLLSLSTAHPAISATLPKLEAWYIMPPPMATRHELMYPPVSAAPQAKRSAGPVSALVGVAGAAVAAVEAPLQYLYGAAEEPAPPPPAETAQTSIESGGVGAAVTYRVSLPITVPSDGTQNKTTVTIEKLGVSLDYVIVPKLAQEAYLRATVTNTSDYTLLPGEASIFHGADFVGKTQLETIAPNEEFKVQLGVDDRIRVKRELVKREVSRKFIGNNRRTIFAYKITLTNLLSTPAKITLFDQIPVGRHENIKVKLDDSTPKPDEQSDLNILKWELELAASEKREVSFSFSVEHPRGMVVQGLG
jgi:uncharacterized protein (TIGR02231 family)